MCHKKYFMFIVVCFCVCAFAWSKWTGFRDFLLIHWGGPTTQQQQHNVNDEPNCAIIFCFSLHRFLFCRYNNFKIFIHQSCFVQRIVVTQPLAPFYHHYSAVVILLR